MPFYRAEVRYGFSPADSHVCRKYFLGGDNTNHIGAGGDLNFPDILITPGDHAPINNIGTWVENYLACLSRVAAPGVKIISVEIWQYDNTDWGDLILQNYVTLNVSNFAVKAGNTDMAGPRGRAFIGGRQSVASSNRSGWLRWHYLAGNYMTLPTLCVPTDVDSTFASYYANIRNFGSVGLRYAVLSTATTIVPSGQDAALPSSVLHLGLRNG